MYSNPYIKHCPSEEIGLHNMNTGLMKLYHEFTKLPVFLNCNRKLQHLKHSVL